MASCNETSIDFNNIPLIALNHSVRKKLGLYLNPANTVAEDWKGVAEKMGFSYLEIKNYETCHNPTLKILEDWQARCPDANVGKLLTIIEDAERSDIICDLKPLIGKLFSTVYVQCIDYQAITKYTFGLKHNF